MEQAFSDMYEATGKKMKAFFYLQKSAAIAETIISTYTAAQNAIRNWSKAGFPGASAIGMGVAGTIIAGGLARVAMISSQMISAAEGGLVPGSSPNDKADNIPARLTAGEYVQPVDTVRHYGADFMEAVRQKLIPRDVGFSLGGMVPRPRYAFAEGGMVAGGRSLADSSVGSGSSSSEGLTINNIVDTSLMDRHMLSPAGQDVVMNVMTENRFGLELLLGLEG